MLRRDFCLLAMTALAIPFAGARADDDDWRRRLDEEDRREKARREQEREDERRSERCNALQRQYNRLWDRADASRDYREANRLNEEASDILAEYNSMGCGVGIGARH